LKPGLKKNWKKQKCLANPVRRKKVLATQNITGRGFENEEGSNPPREALIRRQKNRFLYSKKDRGGGGDHERSGKGPGESIASISAAKKNTSRGEESLTVRASPHTGKTSKQNPSVSTRRLTKGPRSLLQKKKHKHHV